MSDVRPCTCGALLLASAPFNNVEHAPSCPCFDGFLFSEVSDQTRRNVPSKGD